VVADTGDTGVTSVWREQSRHTHRWLVGRPDGALSEGVCKGCGAHRDFMEGKRRLHVREAQPLESLAGAWLGASEDALDEAEALEVSMTRLSDDNERQAQRIACAQLIRGCESAVSDLLVAMDEADAGSPAMRRAREILAGMLSSWQETLRALTPKEAPVRTR
jgi:hypothetical protein